jgi:hypothetical protein
LSPRFLGLLLSSGELLLSMLDPFRGRGHVRAHTRERAVDLRPLREQRRQLLLGKRPLPPRLFERLHHARMALARLRGRDP